MLPLLCRCSLFVSCFFFGNHSSQMILLRLHGECICSLMSSACTMCVCGIGWSKILLVLVGEESDVVM
jgi:hypothetical protein